MQGLCNAAVLAAALLRAVSAQPSVSVARVSFSSANGGQASFNTTGNGTGFATITVNGRTKTIGAMSTPGGNASTFIDIDAIRGPPVEAEVDTDPTTGEPAPPVMSPPSPATPGEEGAVRLVDRVDVNGFATGTVQVFCEGVWGGVCTSNFDDLDAMVACRQLGFSAGVSRPQEPNFRLTQPDPEEVAPFVLENLGCVGNESRLVDCPVFTPSPDASSRGRNDDGFDYFRDYSNPADCDPFRGHYARVACGTSEAGSEGDVRLAAGVSAADGSAQYGRLEVFHNGGWGTVCDNSFVNRFSRRPSFNDQSANVACRQLGFQEGFQIQGLEDEDEASTERVPIVLAGLQCRGSEETLSGCPEFTLGLVPSTCRHNADVYLVCSNGPNAQMDGATRLVDGSADPQGRWEYGRLEIFARGFWSNVCNDDRFTPDAAQVACRALGYGGGAALRFTQSYANSLSQVLFENLPVALAGVDCNGTEATISECQSNDNVIGDCNEITSSTVLSCANTAPGCDRQEGTTEGAVRLRGGFGTLCDPIHTGFIEVLHFDEWGSICANRLSEDNAEDNLVADVVCRQLGFPHGTRVDPLNARSPPPEDDAMSPYSTYYYSYFDYNIAEEAEEPVERYWLSSVRCAGPEGRLIDCDLGAGFRQNNAGCNRRPHRIHIACRQFPVVEALEEVTTPGAVEGDLRLVEEGEVANWRTGNLQVFFEGSWSQVCSTNFEAADANVACRQLGFGAGTVVPQELTEEELAELARTTVFPEVGIIGAGCTGTEERLVDCSASVADPASANNYFNDYTLGRDCVNSNGAGLVLGCVAAPLTGVEAGTEGAFRLTNKTAGDVPGSESGILEVFHAGAWGTLCEGDFGILESTAEIACRDMGFVGGFFQDTDLTTPVLPAWLSGIRCAGPEANVGSCRRSAFGDTSTCGRTQRLFCFSNRRADNSVRLVEGGAEPGGAWEYGRLEILRGGIWNIVEERRFRTEVIGTREVQVLCHTLGFATGAQLLVGQSSPFPAPQSSIVFDARIRCNGMETELADCDINNRDYSFYDYGDVRSTAAALICTTPSGCGGPPAQPVEGDVRLVPLNGTTTPTASCDDVHIGSVELFREGRWGSICAGRFGGEEEEFTLDAQVVCRQLGFPFGTVIDGADTVFNFDYSAPEGVIWATQVVCTGKEERLLDCNFPENFEDVDYSFRYEYNENWPAPSHAAPAPAPEATAPPPSGLVNPRCDRNERDRLSVVCRRFEITESDFIRR